jgi:hypothetical protein
VLRHRHFLIRFQFADELERFGAIDFHLWDRPAALPNQLTGEIEVGNASSFNTVIFHSFIVLCAALCVVRNSRADKPACQQLFIAGLKGRVASRPRGLMVMGEPPPTGRIYRRLQGGRPNPEAFTFAGNGLQPGYFRDDKPNRQETPMRTRTKKRFQNHYLPFVLWKLCLKSGEGRRIKAAGYTRNPDNFRCYGF